MSAPRQLQDLISDVVHAYPTAEMEFDPLPSGVCFLWVTLNGRNFVIEYDPKRSTGVSENLPETPPFVGHDEAYPALETAVRRFKELLADAALHGDQSQMRTAYVMHDKPISK